MFTFFPIAIINIYVHYHMIPYNLTSLRAYNPPKIPMRLPMALAYEVRNADAHGHQKAT